MSARTHIPRRRIHIQIEALACVVIIILCKRIEFWDEGISADITYQKCQTSYWIDSWNPAVHIHVLDTGRGLRHRGWMNMDCRESWHLVRYAEVESSFSYLLRVFQKERNCAEYLGRVPKTNAGSFSKERLKIWVRMRSYRWKIVKHFWPEVGICVSQKKNDFNLVTCGPMDIRWMSIYTANLRADFVIIVLHKERGRLAAWAV